MLKMIQFLIVCFFSWCNSAEGKPLFPGAIYSPSASGSRPLCANKSVTFCEDVDKYPSKLIAELLQQKLFPVEELFTDESEGLDEPPDEYMFNENFSIPSKMIKQNRKIRSAQNLSRNISTKCQPLKKSIQPKIALSKPGEWKYIVQNQNLNKTQKIQVHLCNEKNECGRQCLQFYSPVPMISIDSNGLSSKESFWMPSSCQCMSEFSS